MRIESCPFCGGKNQTVSELDGGPGIGVDGYYVLCLSCRANGPVGSSWEATRSLSYADRVAMPEEEITRLGHEDAIRRWNRQLGQRY